MLINKKIPIIIDTDPGIDDAVAIAAALFHEQIDVRLITTVAGNVSVDKTTNNALKLIEFFAKDIPVAQGAYCPLVRPFEDASHIHGHSGLDGYDFPEPKRKILPEHAVVAMRDVIINSPEPITLVPIGPYTNIALLFMLYPECKKNIERIVVMGGSTGRGNHTPNAEFNIYADPEAAEWVFTSGLPIVMCGLDVTHISKVTPKMVQELQQMNKTGDMLCALFSHYRGGSKETGWNMHDSCTIAYLVKPELFKTVETFVAVETSGKYTFGTTVVDLKNKMKKAPNAQVCIDLDGVAFQQWLLESLQKAI